MKLRSILPLAALALICACQDGARQPTLTEPPAAAAAPSLSATPGATTGNTVCDTYTAHLASLRAESAPDANEVAAYEALAADACDN